ncbi:type II toxin-antitoxin system prevent-host-death family antitoxin [Stenotrophomonas lactitubi]|uniref:type II toxin-antitoxin system Phd/YefM family antitoxin n=1 Tax=Stenotrophomonas lactitubi TaxID=2045214 RepID=UPI00320A6A48
MKSVNIHFAKTHLSALISEASDGDGFVIAKAGKPVVKVIPFNEPIPKEIKRIGFLSGAGFKIPSLEKFNEIGAKEIESMFSGDMDL